MQRFKLLAVLAALVAGGVWFFQHFDVRGLDHVSIKPRGKGPASADATGDLAFAEADPTRTIKIAAYDIQALVRTRPATAPVLHVLADVIRRFDIVAIPQVRTDGPGQGDALDRLLTETNSIGRHYDYVLGPSSSRSAGKERYAYVFDTETIDLDRATIYTVNDPDDLLRRPPLVAWFRARGPAPADAFTFTLAAVATDPGETPSELKTLADVFRAVRNDGHGEDDVLLLGNFNVESHRLGELGRLPNLEAAIVDLPTTTRRNKSCDNILFNRTATVEYMGRSGVMDVMAEYRLSLDQALEISDHLPVWAEFSVFEGRGAANGIASGRKLKTEN